MTHTDLRACPFCGAALRIRNSVNAYGHCETEGFWMNARKVIVPLDDPRQVSGWNTRARTPDTAPSQSDTETDDNGEAMICTGCGSTKTLAALRKRSGVISCCPERHMVRADTALRAAEAENAELTAFRNGYKDTIRRLQDSVSAAEAREKVLREAAEDLVSWFDNTTHGAWVLPAGPFGVDDALEAARRALGGSND